MAYSSFPLGDISKFNVLTSPGLILISLMKRPRTLLWDLANCPWWIMKDLQCVGLAHKTAIGCTKQCYTFPHVGQPVITAVTFWQGFYRSWRGTNYPAMLFYVFISTGSKQCPSPASLIVMHLMMVLSLFLVCPASQAHVTCSHIGMKWKELYSKQRLCDKQILAHFCALSCIQRFLEEVSSVWLLTAEMKPPHPQKRKRKKAKWICAGLFIACRYFVN